MKTRIAIESPYAGNVERNTEFAQNICRTAVRTGEYNPYAMHLFFTQFLDDLVPEDRTLGIDCGLGWTDLADEVWFCLRPGEKLSRGMLLAVQRNDSLNASAEFPRLIRHLRLTQDGRLIRHMGSDTPPSGYPMAENMREKVVFSAGFIARVVQFEEEEWFWEIHNAEGEIWDFFLDGTAPTIEEAEKEALEAIDTLVIGKQSAYKVQVKL